LRVYHRRLLVVKRPVIVVISIVVGWVLASMLDVALEVGGIDIPASMAKTYSQYNTYSEAMVLVLTIFFSWATYQVLARRFLERTVDERPLLERAPAWMRHPSVVGLVIAWVTAVLTVIVYPVAIYMSWRFYVEWRDTESKVCPRCAERVKAAAKVCRHCSQPFETSPA
jgi:ribosomal protein L40E